VEYAAEEGLIGLDNFVNIYENFRSKNLKGEKFTDMQFPPAQ